MKTNLICYCFQYSEEDIVRDIMEHNGVSSILERIRSEKKKGTCSCTFNQPEGR